ncbi:hypothetical protein CBP31_04850 [Oceanisphaera profunda]|uniref:Uncharacterized protein n=1 Tax=Oceanisphaera profunda TaxID=1416627 RepID=A0A1Y0D3C9_9GAMM|nr:hypothetical protein [Oceanisphaera profunda]ART82033.1 hypothetical protein CBP31_04850 [Oceanisphaera profunda]
MSDDVRKGITKAQFNEDNANILFAEIGITAIAVGVYFQSWFWGGGVLLALMICLFIKQIAILLILVFSVGWAVAGYFIGGIFESSQASIVLAILGFLCGLGANISALEWTKDIGDTKKSGTNT